jgi:hypothetical protein
MRDTCVGLHRSLERIPLRERRRLGWAIPRHQLRTMRQSALEDPSVQIDRTQLMCASRKNPSEVQGHLQNCPSGSFRFGTVPYSAQLIRRDQNIPLQEGIANRDFDFASGPTSIGAIDPSYRRNRMPACAFGLYRFLEP